MEICTTTDDISAKQLSPPVFNAMQHSIGRWNRTISFITKVFYLFFKFYINLCQTFHDDMTKWYGGDSSHSVLIHKTGGLFIISE
jgi:hypothetical protein